MSTYLQAHALQRLVAARHQVLARTPLAVRARPHEIAGLRRDDHLVAERVEVLAHQRAEVFLGRARRRAVVVSQVEVRDAEVEGAARDGAAVLEDVDVAEVVPQARARPPAAARRSRPRGCSASTGNACRRAGNPWIGLCYWRTFRRARNIANPRRQNQDARYALASPRDQPDAGAQQSHARQAQSR